MLVSEHVQILVGQVVAQLPLLPRDEEAGVLQTEGSPLLSVLPSTEDTQLLARGGQAVAVLHHLLCTPLQCALVHAATHQSMVHGAHTTACCSAGHGAEESKYRAGLAILHHARHPVSH